MVGWQRRFNNRVRPYGLNVLDPEDPVAISPLPTVTELITAREQETAKAKLKEKTVALRLIEHRTKGLNFQNIALMDVVILVLLGILCVCMYIMKNEENTEEQTTQKFIEIESPKIKIGSTTWATHILHLANRTDTGFYDRLHKKAQVLSPRPRDTMERINMEQLALKFLFVRDPFERLLSAYLDKIAQPSKGAEIKTFGKVQRIIAKINNNTFDPLKQGPTFEQFVDFVSKPIPKQVKASFRGAVDSKINFHWRPVFLNCFPCNYRYDIIGKMETFNEDSQYIKEKLNLPIEIDFRGNSGKNGQASNNRTLEAFKNIKLEAVERLYRSFQPDFDLFGYDVEKYRQVAKKD